MATASVRLDQDLVEKATIMDTNLHRTLPKHKHHWDNTGTTTHKKNNLTNTKLQKTHI